MINSREFINKILRYWLALEALTPQTADKAHPHDKIEPSYEINKEKGAMPWMEGHEHRRKQPRDQHQWHYIVQAGLYDIRKFYENILDEVKNLIADNEREDDEYDRVSGTGRLYDVEVDAKGRPIVETFALSMAGWAAGVILHQGVGALQQGTWCNLNGLPQPGREEIQRRSGLSGFDTLEAALRKELAERVRMLEKPVDKAWFDDFTRLVIRHCGLTEELLGTTPRYIVKSKQLKKVQKNSVPDQLRDRKRDQSLDQFHDHPHDQPRIASPSEVDHVADARPVEEGLINSFYIADLHRIESSSYLGGDAFLSYFKSIIDRDSGERRIDLRSKEGEMEVVRLLHPRYFPQGSWPSGYPLVRSQQFAVNALWNHLTSKQGGLFAVNGPPGTGKTTLLRDIVAAVVVDRAKILSEYDDPRKIFLPKRKYDENEPPYYPIQNLDHAIVVASSNNGAVENVTLELPKTDAVANNFVNQAAYFQELAIALLQSAEKQSSVSKSWGLIAARLGKKENRDQFIQIVLEKRPVLHRSEVSAEAIGLIHRLKEISDGKRSPEKSWSEVVKDFEEALRKEQAHRSRIAREAENLNHYLDVRRSIRNQMRQIQEYKYKERISKLEQEIEQLKNRRSQLEVDIQRRRDAWLHHKRRKPGWLETLRTFGRSYRRWRHKLKELEAEYQEGLNLEEKLIADLREKKSVEGKTNKD